MTDDTRAAPTPEATTADKARYGECSGCHGARTAEDFARSLTHCVACIEAADAQHAASSARPEATGAPEPEGDAVIATLRDLAQEAEWAAEGYETNGVHFTRCREEAAALRHAADRLATVAALTAEREALAEDVRIAAGECLVPIPAPGSDMSRVMLANRQLARQRDEAEARAAEWEAIARTNFTDQQAANDVASRALTAERGARETHQQDLEKT